MSNKKRSSRGTWYHRSISLLLSIFIVLCFIPISVYSSATTETEFSSGNSEPPQANTGNSTQISTPFPNNSKALRTKIEENLELREENIKHYFMPDGTCKAVVFANSIHRKNENGIWMDIDNSLSLVTKENLSYYTTPDGRSTFVSSFKANEPFFSLKDSGNVIDENGSGYELSMSFVSLTEHEALISSSDIQRSSEPPTVINTRYTKQSEWDTLEAATRINQNQGAILYKNVTSNVDLQYILDGNDVKENIIVKTKASSYCYRFLLSLSGLYADLKESGCIVLYDSESHEKQYLIPAPYMEDSNGCVSYDNVHYELIDLKNGRYMLSVLADEEWMNAEERAFPVIIDPTITVNSLIYDGYIHPAYPEENFGFEQEMPIDPDSTIVYIKANLLSLPTNSQIHDGTLYFYYYDPGVNDGHYLDIGVYEVLDWWSEDYLTYELMSNYENMGLAPNRLDLVTTPCATSITSTTPGLASANVTAAVQHWYNGQNNDGIALLRESGTTYGICVKSAETGAYSPYFVITYSEAQIASGVYKLKSTYNGFYMDVTEGKHTAGTKLVQWSGETLDYRRNQMFKITYLNTIDGKNYYSIRSMTNNAMGISSALSGTNRDVEQQPISYSDTWDYLSWDSIWYISFRGDHYILKNGQTTYSSYLSTPANQLAGQTLITADSISDTAKWDLEQYTNLFMEEILWDDNTPTTIIKSRTSVTNPSVTYQAYMYSSVIGRNGPVTYSLKNVDGLDTEKATINTYTGMLLALDWGTVVLSATFEGASSPSTLNIAIKTENCVTVNVDIKYDQFFVNRSSDEMMDLLQYADALQEKYIEDFNIWVNYSTPIQYRSIAESCDSVTSYLSLCTCVSDDSCENYTYDSSGNPNFNNCHHTNIHAEALHVKSIATSSNLQMAFSGHRFCHNIDGEHGTVDHDGTRVSGFHGVNVAIIQYEANDLFGSAQTVIHEFGHFYGAKDHYGGSTPSTESMNATYGTNSFSPNCMYGESRSDQNIKENLIICTGCRNIIQANYNRYS